MNEGLACLNSPGAHHNFTHAGTYQHTCPKTAFQVHSSTLQSPVSSYKPSKVQLNVCVHFDLLFWFGDKLFFWAVADSVTVYVTIRIFGPTSYVRIFDRRSVTYGALRRRRSWRGAWAAHLWCARQAHQHAHQAKLDCPSRTTNVTTAYRLLHRSCSGRGTCVGNGAGPVIIALSQHSGLQQMRAQHGKFWGVEKCVRKL